MPYTLRIPLALAVGVVNKDILGFYAIASLVEDSLKYPEKTFLFIDETNMSEQNKLSLKYVKELVKNNGVNCFNSYEEINKFLCNSQC